MKRLILCLSLLYTFGQVYAQKSQDRQSILDFCGCYEVSFQFAETFTPDPNYTFHDNYYSSGLEWIVPVAVEEDFISLQHLLIVGRGDKKSVIKHWRQDWEFEDRGLFAYVGNHQWNYRGFDEDDVQGQWTQKVFEVSDAPRYAASATWVHVDGRHYWESTSDAPLPRREYTKRDDYNILQRTNHHEITEYGHFHEQDNVKIAKKPSRERIRAYEKGMNIYTKVDDARCASAQKWWEENRQFWADVRSVWQEVFDQQDIIRIQPKVDGQPMFMRLFPLGEALSAQGIYDSREAKERIRQVIRQYVDAPATVAVD